MPNPAVLLLIGAATGLLAGALGAGGGFATVVLLIAAGVGAHEAVGTSLVFVLFVAAVGAITHLRQGSARLALAVALGAPAAAMAPVGAQIGDSLGERTLTLCFGILTGLVALALARRAVTGSRTPVPVAGGATPEAAPWRASGRILVAAAGGGAAIGIMQGLFGVGGGFLLMPFMVLALGVPEHLAVGSSLIAIVIGSVSGAARHASLGNIDASLLPWLLPGGFAASFAGARLSKRMTPAQIVWVFLALMVASTAYLIAKAL